jgi:hypothetical protein
LWTPEAWGPGPRPWAYLAALLVYVALGLLVRTFVLNWIIGPLFLLLTLYLLPLAFRKSVRP